MPGDLIDGISGAVQPHPEVRHVFNEHWNSHPEHPEEMVRLWHDHLFHRPIAAPLLARVLDDLRRGIEAPVALATLLASPEFYVSVGGSVDGFVRRSFLELVGRAADRRGIPFLVRTHASRRPGTGCA